MLLHQFGEVVKSACYVTGKSRFNGEGKKGVLVEGTDEDEDEDEDENIEEGIVDTYGKGKESKAQQDSYIANKREDPHVVMPTKFMSGSVEA